MWETENWGRVKLNLKVPLENQGTSHIGGLNERLFPLIYTDLTLNRDLTRGHRAPLLS